MRKIFIILKGLIVGGTMMVPGVSGGSMAMVLGIYDELISSVSSFFKHKKKSLIFLLLFLAGALSGMLLFSKPLGNLLTEYPVVLMYFFMGAVAGSIPMILRKAQILKRRDPTEPAVKKKRPVDYLLWVLFLALGILAVMLLGLLPKDLLSFEQHSFIFYLMLFLAGIVAAIALVLPGISVSHMFYMLGLYEPILSMFEAGLSAQWFSLIPLAIGLLAGIMLTTRILELAMLRQPTPTYLIILGFLIGSIFDVFPGVPVGWEIPVCILLFSAGFLIIFFLSKIEERQEAQREAEEAE